MILDAIAFGAHPDDIELTCSGTLIKLVTKGYKIGMVSLTAGELSTRGNRVTRKQEFADAAEIVGAEIHQTLNLPDGQLSNDNEHKTEIIHTIRRYRPRIVLAPFWEDRHPDHAAASLLVREASFLSGLKKIETGQKPHRPYKVIYYPSRMEFSPSFIVDVSLHHKQKMNAIRSYRSQFADSWEDKTQTNISHPGFLKTIVARSQLYGSYIGVEHGEPFLVREPIKLSDPVDFFGPEYSKAFV